MTNSVQRYRAQSKYDRKSQDLGLSRYKLLCGTGLNPDEKTVIQKYTSQGDNILEIGSGVFHRTAELYKSLGLHFYGVEPLIGIALGGPYFDQTVTEYFSPSSLENPIIGGKTFSFVGCFGLVFNGIISQDRTNAFWEGLSILAHEHKAIIAFDTLVAPYSRNPEEEFNTAQRGKLQTSAIQQYFPSRSEIQRALKAHGLQIIEELDSVVMRKLQKLIVLKAA